MPPRVEAPVTGGWPDSAEALVAQQQRLASVTPAMWAVPDLPPRLGGCFVCFPRGYTGPGSPGDAAWAAAAVVFRGRVIARQVALGSARAPYEPGLMALREGPLLEAAVRPLLGEIDVLLVNATGRDHPRRAGLALHLGAVLDVPTIGITHRPLLAAGEWPSDEPGADCPLSLDGDVVAAWVRTRPGRRPLVIHPAWRTDVATAVEVIRRYGGWHRTPQPLREARRLARRARAAG